MNMQSNTIDIPTKRRRTGKPKRSEVVEAIVRDARTAGVSCEEFTAESLLEFLYRFLNFIERRSYRNCWYVSEVRLENLLEVLKAVIPDDVIIPDPGSAHDLVNRFLMPDGERTLTRMESRLLPNGHCVLMVYEH